MPSPRINRLRNRKIPGSIFDKYDRSMYNAQKTGLGVTGMRRKPNRRIVCTILAFLILILCGCGRIGQSKQSKDSAQSEMDDVLVQFMTCLEHNDLEGAKALAYGPEEMTQSFPVIEQYWPAHHDDPFEASGLELDSIANQTQTYESIFAVYLVRSGGEDFQVTLVYRRDAGGNGLVSLNATRTQEMLDRGMIPQALGQPVAKKTVGQWCFTVFWVLMCLLCLWTVIDLIRKRPKLYILWILLCLVFVGAAVYSSSGGISFVLRFGLFTPTKWTRYPIGVDCYQICLPIGSIIYWCRKIPYFLFRIKERRAMRQTRSSSSSHHRHSSHHRSSSHHRHSSSSHHGKSGSSHHH